MHSTHTRPPGCIDTNTFRQALGFLSLNSPLYWGEVYCFICCKGSYLCKTRIISYNKNRERQAREGRGWGNDNNNTQKPAPVWILAWNYSEVYFVYTLYTDYGGDAGCHYNLNLMLGTWSSVTRNHLQQLQPFNIFITFLSRLNNLKMQIHTNIFHISVSYRGAFILVSV